METLDLIQGTPEWKAARLNYFTASEAPAMLGLSRHMTRTELLDYKATGIDKPVDAATQWRFDEGHRVEALARVIVERSLGDLFPVTGHAVVDGLPLLASFDGITMDDSVIWENKAYNKDLVQDVIANELSGHYWPQLEQQLLISGAEKVWFTTSDGTPDNTHGCWYKSVPERRAQLLAGWRQFAADLKDHQPVTHAAKPQAEPIERLPAVVLSVSGQLSASNLPQVTPRFDAFLASVNTELKTDSDFANGEANAKFSRATAKALKAKAKEVVDQITSISDAVRTLEHYADKFDALGLKLEKAVKSQKEAIASAIIAAAREKLAEHTLKLDRRIGRPCMPIIQADFNTAVKNKRTLESLHNAVNTELARAKMEASDVADRIELNLQDARLDAFAFLFKDINTLCLKAADDFSAVVGSRVAEYQAQQARLQEAAERQARMPAPVVAPPIDQANNTAVVANVATTVATNVAALPNPATIVGTTTRQAPSGLRRNIHDRLDRLDEQQLRDVLAFLDARYPLQQAA